MKYKNLLFTIFFLGAVHSYAQNLDSLKTQLQNAASDKDRCRLLYGISLRFSSLGEHDTAFAYINRSARLAKKVHYDTMSMESMAYAAEISIDLMRYDQVIRYLDTAIAYARTSGNSHRQMQILIRKARLLTSMLITEGVIACCREALTIARSLNSRVDEAEIYCQLGFYYGQLHNYRAQLDYINLSIPIYDSLKMYDMVANNYRQISMNYSRQKKYRQSLRYAMTADSLNEKMGFTRERNMLRLHMAIVYKNLNDYDRAIALNKALLDSFKHEEFSRMVIYSNLGIAQSLKGQFADARRSLFTALELNKKYKTPDIDIENYKELGRAFLRVSQYDSALYYAQYSERLCKESKTDINKYQECVAALSDIYAAMGDMANAYAYSKQYAVLQDSIFQQILASNLADAETRFNVSEKDKELSVLSTENEMQRLRSRQQTILNLSLLVGLLLGVVILVLTVRSSRRTLKQNALLNDQKRILQAQKTTLEEQKEALEQQKKVIDEQVVQLAGAATMKSKFLANISHELRTPVTLLNGMLGMMRTRKQPHAPTKEQERLDIAYNNSRKLQQMVEEILDLTKLEHNRSLPVYETREAGPLLRKVVSAFEPLIEQEELVLEYEDAAAAGAYISVDVAKFEKVMNNLVYNAIKFNRKGGYIKVAVSVSANRRHVEINVSDTGIGISAADLPHIFEHFYQAESQGVKADGAGIGLSLVKEFSDLMGGSVQVSSRQGEGSSFVLRFPLVEHVVAGEVEAEVMELPEEDWAGFASRQLVLVVEDNAEMRYYLQDVLDDKAHIATAGNGHEAMEWLEQKIPDLIISDIMMPGIDGRELVSYLKSQDRYKKIPIITLTALADKESQISFLKLGVDDYIVKPFNADELRIRVYNLLSNQAERNRYNEQESVSVDPADEKAAEEFRNKISGYVLANIHKHNVSTADLAYEFSLSERQLFRISKSLTGYSPAQLIKEVRLQRAYELLVSGDIYKVEDVSKRVGFEKAGYFSRLFFERFGKRPSDFL